MTTADDNPAMGAGWYAVEVRQHGEPYEAGPELGNLPVRAVEFNVQLDPSEVEVHQEIEAQIEAQRYLAARVAVEAVATGTDWPARRYAVRVEGRHSTSTYVAEIGQHREFTLKAARAGDWAF